MRNNVTVDAQLLGEHLLGRENDSHKGDYGHALLVCGCDSMPGAAVLATSAALKSGCGLVTLHSTRSVAQIVAGICPSALLSFDDAPVFCATDIFPDKFSVVGMGPGLSRTTEPQCAFRVLLERCREASVPMVLDADALYFLAKEPSLLDYRHIPDGSVMTPHDGELSRLISWSSPDEKLSGIRDLAEKTGCIIISKGYRSKVIIPGNENIYEISTGNPGMAKGGSGDVLTGLLTGLLARGYSPEVASVMAPWIHGYSGDRCTEAFGTEAFNSRDIVENLFQGFTALQKV